MLVNFRFLYIALVTPALIVWQSHPSQSLLYLTFYALEGFEYGISVGRGKTERPVIVFGCQMPCPLS